MTRLQSLGIGLLFAYGALVNGYLVGHLLCRDCVPIIAQLNHLAHWLTLVCWLILIFLFGIRLITGHWISSPPIGLLYIPGAIAFLGWYGALFLPPPNPTSDSPTFSIATYNNEDENADAEQVFDVILALDTDIIALQEIHYELSTDMGDMIREKYPHHAKTVVQGVETLVILSRFPILEASDTLRGDLVNVNLTAPRYLRVVVEIYGQRTVIYNFHPRRPTFKPLITYDDQLHRRAIIDILTQIHRETDPVFLLCDCNLTPRTAQYDWLADRLTDTHQAVGWGLGLTHPGLPQLPFANTRIDYIWHDAHAFRAHEINVWDNNGTSDHWAIVATFSLKTPTLPALPYGQTN